MNKLTLGSLFDGSGGFPLGAVLTGIEPLWASEVEPFPIRVTTKRLPEVVHLGDINKIDGAAVPPVDIITGGFCCQDLSVAGKRAGLHGERSGLFFQITRIIKEMLEATGGEYPKFAVLENVPGMYSSRDGLDFQEVLNEIIKIKDETLSVPLPEKGRWSTSGEIVGDGFSIGWRTLDAQFWGVAQRRRRCYIVVDFTAGRAGEILFDESRLSGNPAPCGLARQEATGDSSDCARGAVSCLNDQGGGFMDVSEDVTGTLRAQEHRHQPIVFEPGAASRVGGHVWEGITGALRADAGDNQAAVVIENHPADSRVKIDESGVVQTLSGRMGTGGGNVPLVMNERQYAMTASEEVANTLTGTDYKGTQCVFEPKTLKIRCGKEGGGKGPLIQDNLSATLGCSNDQTLFEPKAYGICALHSNSMQSANPDSGVYEAGTSRTLDTSGGSPACNQGGIAVVAFAQNQRNEVRDLNDVAGALAAEPGMKQQTYVLEGNGIRPSHRGDGIGEDVSFTLNTVERHAVCYQDKVGSLCASDYKFPQSQQIEEGKAVVEQVAFGNNGFGRYDENPATLKAKGGDFPGGENIVVENRYVVRRLTPTECALLQGFPPNWCKGLETPEPTEDDIACWTQVWETHRLCMGKSTKPKSKKQIVKWLADPHSDAAEYKMWGNGVALPCVVFVLSGIAHYA